MDDTLIFLSLEDEGIINLKRILGCFQVCSGLKINFSKSSLSGIMITDELMNRFSSILGCSSTALLVVYLGLPLYFKKASYKDWTSVLDNLPMGGRFTLITSVLSAILTYFLSMLHLPKRVEVKIDHIRRRFLWKNQTSTNSSYCLAK